MKESVLTDINEIKKQCEETRARLCASLPNLINHGYHFYTTFLNTCKQTDEHAVVINLYWQHLTMLDALEEMFNESIVAPAVLQLRGCLESLLYIGFISCADTIRKSRYYIYWHLLKDKEKWEECLATLKAERTYFSMSGELKRVAEESIAARLQDLNADAFQDARMAYSRFKRPTKNAWYAPFFPNRVGLRALAEELQVEEWYHHLYAPWSGTAHCGDYLTGMPWDSRGNTQPLPLRNPDSLASVGLIAIKFGIEATREVLQLVRPDELYPYDLWTHQNISANRMWLRERARLDAAIAHSRMTHE